MVEREVNPLEQRHMALSSRFKAAWAFHQLLIGMQRLNASGKFDNNSDTFQSALARLKSCSDNLQRHTEVQKTVAAELAGLEQEVGELCDSLASQDERITPSELRRFFTQVRALDDRILIDIIRFYLEVQRGQEWQRDRLDKVDFLLSRLAEKVGGPNLQTDQRRLDKVLAGLLSSVGPIVMEESELMDVIKNLQDLRSEVRWVKSFDELSESSLVEIYRGLKHELKGGIFHPKILPLVVDVNNVFRRRIDDLRAREETRLLDEYQQLSRLEESPHPHSVELVADLQDLRQRVEKFRSQTKSDDVRIGELILLRDSLREVSARLDDQTAGQGSAAYPAPQPSEVVGFETGSPVRASLVPDFDALQPHWSDLLKALSGIAEESPASDPDHPAALQAFKLEPREFAAFHKTVGSDPANVGIEQFILAAASLRRRVSQEAEQLRDWQSKNPGAVPELEVRISRETARMADAFVKHFAHLVEQAVLDGDQEEPRALLLLKEKLTRELSGLELLVWRLFAGAPEFDESRSAGAARGLEPFGRLSEG